jgi:DUF971 family protein
MKAPDRLCVDAAARLLTLYWPDGATQRITHARLRVTCPCAGCRRVRLAGGAPEVDPDVLLSAIEPMGYGVQLAFSDGHARGIYPWAWLETLGSDELVSEV